MSITLNGMADSIEQWLRGNEHYMEAIAVLSEEKSALTIDCKHLMSSDLEKEILTKITKEYKATLAAFAIAVRSIWTEVHGASTTLEPLIRLRNIFGEKIELKTVGAYYCDKLVTVRGRIATMTPIKPWLYRTRFHCNNCQLDMAKTSELDGQIMRPQKKCTECGQSAIDILGMDAIDCRIVILMNTKPTTTPQNLRVFCSGKDLCDKITGGGRVIDVFGMLDIDYGTGTDTPVYRLVANNVYQVGSDTEEYDLTPDDLVRFDVKNPDSIVNKPQFWEKSVHSYAPEVLGLEEIKEALLMQCSSLRIYENEMEETMNKARQRLDSLTINMLLAGSPSTGKTKLLLRTASYAPNSAYNSFATSTAAGLTVVANKDKDTNQFLITPGFFPSCHQGVACTDEFDKATPEIFQKLHEIGSNKTVSYSKGTEKGTLPSECAWLFACNSVFPYWNEQAGIQKNLRFMPPSFITRFDAIFIVLDKINPELDAKLAEKVIENSTEEYWAQYFDDNEERFGFRTMKKYILYVTKYVAVPAMSDTIYTRIVDYYQKKRQNEELKGLITPRYMNAVIRFATMHARYLQKAEVDMIDIDIAVRLLDLSMRATAFDPVTNKLDPALAIGGLSQHDQDKQLNDEEAIRKAFRIVREQTKRMDGWASTNELAEQLKILVGWDLEYTVRILTKRKDVVIVSHNLRSDPGWKLV